MKECLVARRLRGYPMYGLGFTGNEVGLESNAPVVGRAISALDSMKCIYQN
jgi:hypothetical protein